MNLILCGLPKCGKTTLGKQLAKKLNRSFIDIDQLIENAYYFMKKKRATCRQIYLEEGEGFFRTIETMEITSLKGLENHVIALGGGGLNDFKNVEILKTIGQLVYLKSSPSLLLNRIRSLQMPAYLYRPLVENSHLDLARLSQIDPPRHPSRLGKGSLFRMRDAQLEAGIDQKQFELSFYALAKKRIPLYESAADYTIDTFLLNRDEMLWRVMDLVLTLE